MNQERIKQIDKEIEKLQAEKDKLEEIERLPETERKVNEYLSNAYFGKRLAESGHSLDEYGIWQVHGEDPNCDFGGHHSEPRLGIVQGTLKEALEYAVEHKNFYTWGGGGRIEKVEIITPKKN